MREYFFPLMDDITKLTRSGMNSMADAIVACAKVVSWQ